MQDHVRAIIEAMGEDPEREGLKKTPERVAKAYKMLTAGYTEDLDTIVNGALFSSEMDELVLVKDIEMYSLCEHHMLPFFGKAHVGYIPNGKVIGVSKIARIVDHFARRLQIQERLTTEIADAMMKYTGALGVGVVIEAKHLCMMMRGVEKQNSVMKTSIVRGTFRNNPGCRNEFLSLIN